MGKPLSAAHKAAISAGMKRYWASRNGSSDGGRKIQSLETGKTISREEAASIMFGSGARKKTAGKKVRTRRRRG